MNRDLYNQNRNKRSQSRDALVMFINDLSIFDMDSIRSQLGMLSLISRQTNEISRESGVNIVFFIMFWAFYFCFNSNFKSVLIYLKVDFNAWKGIFEI